MGLADFQLSAVRLVMNLKMQNCTADARGRSESEDQRLYNKWLAVPNSRI